MTHPSLKNSLFYACLALVLGATGLWIYGGVALFDWVEVAEMMPYQKVVDTRAGQDLHSTVYLIRQNFQIQAIPLDSTPEILGIIVALMGLAVLLFSVLPAWQALLGATLWLGIVVFSLSDASLVSLTQIISSQIFSLSLLAFAGLSVLSCLLYTSDAADE
jgi:hypothetical protein